MKIIHRQSSTFRFSEVGILLLLVGGLLIGGCGGSGGTVTQGQGPILVDSIVQRVDAVVRPIAGLNSPNDDFGATMPLDTSLILFSSSRGASKLQRIYLSRRVAGAWSSPDTVVVLNSENTNNGVPSITPGGESIYFAGDDYGFGDCDLYRADVGPRGDVVREQSPWTIPTNLGLGLNGIYWDSEPCVSADGSLLYFSSNRPGGFGGRDIWVCRRNRDGSWDQPINVGEPVNTEFDEVTPWLSPDNQTLSFSSNGHPGLGGFDIFTATEIGGVVVTQHLGTPINTPADDIAFSLSSDGHHAFLSSNREGGSGGFDIYSVTPVPFDVDPIMIVQGRVRGADVQGREGAPIIATLDVTDLTSDQSLGRFTTDPETGLYSIVLPRGFDYGITAQAPNHLFSSQQVYVPKSLEKDDARTINFQLRPITGTIRLLVFFKMNESNLLRQSTADLDRAVDFLRANDKINIEIAGHTDNTGDPGRAQILSLERAQAVKSYLVGNRVRADRIKAVGYGPRQPIGTNETEEGRALNRRVEMRILENN